jgi:dTDP-glucose 4,6-dehydratase
LERDLEWVLERTGSFWEALAGADVFLTGGRGFVGSWLLESFAWANRRLTLRARISVVTRDAERFRSEKPHLAGDASVEVLQGDLGTLPIPRRPFRYAIHSAAEAGATQRVVEIIKAQGVRRLLYSGSGAAYGEQPADVERLDEGFVAPIECCTPYGRAKREAEAVCLGAGEVGVEVVIGRLFAFVGPYLPLDKNFAAGNFVRDAYGGGPICVKGDGTPLRSYLYGADMAVWLWTLLIHGVAGHTYNVGSDRAISILDLARTVERVCGVTRGVRVALPAEDGVAPKRYIPSIARARKEFGLDAWTSLEEGIERMFQFSMK